MDYETSTDKLGESCRGRHPEPSILPGSDGLAGLLHEGTRLTHATTLPNDPLQEGPQEKIWEVQPERNESTDAVSNANETATNNALGRDRSQLLEALSLSQDRLAHRRLSTAELHIVDAFGSHVTRADGMYLLSEEDLHKGLRNLLVEAYTTLGVEQSDQLDPTTSWPSQWEPHRPRLDPDLHAIVPSNEPGAESVTTVSNPTTTYAKFDLVESKVRTMSRDRYSMTSATTLISRQSVSRVTWQQDQLDSEDLTDVESGPSDDENAGRLMMHPRNHSARSAQLCARRFPVPISLEEFASEVRKASRGSGSDDLGPRLTSFPRLPSRHCTNEWTSGYRDQHEEHDTWALSENDRHLRESCSRAPSTGDVTGPQTDVVRHHDNTERAVTSQTSRMGGGIGTASHRRRSSVIPGQEAEPDEALLPNLLGRIRKGGHKLLHRHHSHEEASAALSSWTSDPEVPTGGNARATELRAVEWQPRNRTSKDSIVRGRLLEVSGSGEGSIPESSLGGELVGSQRRHTCSEDCRPDVCMDELVQ